MNYGQVFSKNGHQLGRAKRPTHRSTTKGTSTGAPAKSRACSITAGDDVIQVAHDAYAMYFNENAVYPKVFPSLANMEEEVIDLSLGLLHGGENAAGSMTTGGTESIFLAIKSARDWARANRPIDGTPEILTSRTAHPAFDRAAELLDMKVVRVNPGPRFPSRC